MCWLVEYPVGSGNKTILVAGGLSSFAPLSGPAYGAYNSTEVYNVDTNTWTKSLTLPTLRSEGTSLTIRNRYLWFGGRSGSTTVAGTNTVLEFNPVSGWMTSSMVLPSASSFPIVIPYNF
jgi:predicted heme/steroid binding protein